MSLKTHGSLKYGDGETNRHQILNNIVMHCMLCYTNTMAYQAAAIAPWFHLHLPFCGGPGFESQANTSALSSIYIVEIETVIGIPTRKGIKSIKRGPDWPIKQKHSN